MIQKSREAPIFLQSEIGLEEGFFAAGVEDAENDWPRGFAQEREKLGQEAHAGVVGEREACI